MPAADRIRPSAILVAVLATALRRATVPLMRLSAPSPAPTLTTVALRRLDSVRDAMMAALLSLPMARSVTLRPRSGAGLPMTELAGFALMAVLFLAFVQLARRIEHMQPLLAEDTETIRHKRDLRQGMLATSPAGVVVADANGARERGTTTVGAEALLADRQLFAQVRALQAPCDDNEQTLPLAPAACTYSPSTEPRASRPTGRSPTATSSFAS